MPAGTILNCGIKSVEEKAAEVSMMFRLTKAYANFRNPAWDTEQNIEVLTRTFVRDEMGQLLGAQLPSEVFLELTDVIFNVVYPSYPRRVYTEDEGFAG